MRIGEWEASTAMIENAICPRGNGVAGCARRSTGGEIRGDVVRNISAKRLRFVPIGRVAA